MVKRLKRLMVSVLIVSAIFVVLGSVFYLIVTKQWGEYVFLVGIFIIGVGIVYDEIKYWDMFRK